MAVETIDLLLDIIALAKNTIGGAELLKISLTTNYNKEVALAWERVRGQVFSLNKEHL